MAANREKWPKKHCPEGQLAESTIGGRERFAKNEDRVTITFRFREGASHRDGPGLEGKMKLRFLALALAGLGATCAQAGTPGYIQCGTYDSYLLLYRSIDKFEELGKMRCGEKVEILGHVPGYYQVRVEDGRVGWVIEGDVSTTPPPPHDTYTFGMTDAPKAASVASRAASAPATRTAPGGALTNEDVIAAHSNATAVAALLDKMKTTPCDFDTSPLAIRRLRAAQVPDKLILAMLGTPAPSAPAAGQVTVAVKIPAETAIDLHLARAVPSGGLLDGAYVELIADEDLVVHGALVVQKGATARARVLGFRPAGSMTHPGQVAWFLQDIQTVNGGTIPAYFAEKQPGKLHTKLLDGYPFFLSEFDKGEAAIPATKTKIRAVIWPGSIYEESQPPTTAAAAATLQAKAEVSATPANAAPIETVKPVAAETQRPAASDSPAAAPAPAETAGKKAEATAAAAQPPAEPAKDEAAETAKLAGTVVAKAKATTDERLGQTSGAANSAAGSATAPSAAPTSSATQGGTGGPAAQSTPQPAPQNYATPENEP